jgi:hypothetical protein
MYTLLTESNDANDGPNGYGRRSSVNSRSKVFFIK